MLMIHRATDGVSYLPAPVCSRLSFAPYLRISVLALRSHSKSDRL